MGFEDFVFQLHHLSSGDHEDQREVMVQAWLWGGQMFLARPPPTETSWNKVFESSKVCLGHGKHPGSTKFADRFSIGLKLHPLYSDPLHSEDDAHPPIEDMTPPAVEAEVLPGSFWRAAYDAAPIITTDGMAMVFVDFSEPEFHDTSAKLQMKLCICPCSYGQVLQAVALQANPGDTVGEKHLTWTWSANSTKLRSFEIERLLTVELRLPKLRLQTGTSTISTAGATGHSYSSQLLPQAHPRLYAPQLWLRAMVFQEGEAIAKIDEEVVLPVTVARFLQPLDCGEQELQVQS